MNDYIETIAAAALSNALVATLLGVLAWSASRWARPTVAHALWLLVLIKLVTPPLFQTPVRVPTVLTSRKVEAAERSTASATDALVEVPGIAAPADVQSPPAATTAASAQIAGELVAKKALVNTALANIALANTVAFPADEPFGDEESEGDIPSSAELPSDDLHLPDAQWTLALPSQQGSNEIAAVPPRTEPDDLPQASIEVSQLFPTAPVVLPAPTSPHREQLVQDQPSAATASETVATPASGRNAAAVLLGLWLFGSMMWFALAGIRILRFRRVLRGAIPATPPLQDEVAALASEFGLARAPDVLVVPGQISPLVCTPLGRAVLVMPRDLLARFSDEQRAAVIAHELAHLRRRDHWTRWLELVAVGCYWWLPTVWFARRQLHAAEEACCDAWVVWLLPERSRDYARALLETIDFLTPAPDAPLLASGFSRASNLKRRFDMILRQNASHRLSWPARIGIAATGFVILPWSLTALSADETPKAPAAANQNNPFAELPLAKSPPSAENTPAAGLPGAAPPAAESSTAPVAPKALPSPASPPSAENPPAAGGPPTDAPITEPRRDDDSPSLAPSIGPPGASNTPAGLPPTQPGPGAAPRFPAPSLAPPSAAPAPTNPIPTPPVARSPAWTDPRPMDPFASPTPTAPRADGSLADANVTARLERLEATTAELLALVRQLRDERHASRGRSVRNDTVDKPVATDFIVRYGHGDRQLDIKVAGRQIMATDASTGKALWTTTMPWPVRAIQGTAGGLAALGSDQSSAAFIDPGTGEVKPAKISDVSGSYPTATESRPGAAPTLPAIPKYPTQATRATVVPAARNQEIAKIEAEMLDAERSLAQQRAKLQHQARQFETRRARLERKLDALSDDASAEERAKVTAELEQAEDRAADMQFEVDTFEADLEFKVRELQLKRDQVLRALNTASRYTNPNADPQPKLPEPGRKPQQ